MKNSDTPPRLSGVIIAFQGLLSDSFKPFEHSEHDAHRDEADAEEYCPSHPDGACVVDEWADPEQEVADSGCSEPETLTETLKMLGRYFRHERETQG